MYKIMIAVPLAMLAVPAAAQTTLTTGAEYGSGRYGTGERIETLSVTNRIETRSGRLRLSAALPWQRLEAPGNVVGGGGLLGLPIIVDPTRPTARQVREGLGDLRLGAGYSLDAPAGLILTASSEVKLPTAARGLGTGAVDVAVGAEATKRIGPLSPFVAVGYTMPGDPRGFKLRNSLSARGGVAARLGESVSGQIGYAHAQSPSPLVPDERLLTTGLNAALSRRVSLGLHGAAGLSEGAPDFGAGVQIGFRIF